MDYMVFKPLGMTHTFVMDFKKDSAKVSKSYYNNGNEWKYDQLDITYGDKNIYSTPRDLYKMDVAMYSDKFLPKKLKEKAWSGYSYEKPGVKNYGLAIRIMEWGNGNKILYHNGLWHGNHSVYVRDFDHQATIIAIGNRKNGIIYKTFSLVNLFGNYPFQMLPTQNKDSFDTLKQIKKDIDSVKQKTLEQRVKHTRKRVDSLKKINRELRKK
jgi:CubicO group peptidase (beta-lactamase class C family)